MATTVTIPGTAAAAGPGAAAVGSGPGRSAPAAVAVEFSDALDKVTVDGATVGGLSDLAYDRRSASYVSSLCDHAGDPSRLWFFRNLLSPRVSRLGSIRRRARG